MDHFKIHFVAHQFPDIADSTLDHGGPEIETGSNKEHGHTKIMGNSMP